MNLRFSTFLFFKHIQEEKQFSQFLLILQVGLDIHLHRRLDLTTSIRQLTVINKQEERYLLSDLGFRYNF